MQTPRWNTTQHAPHIYQLIRMLDGAVGYTRADTVATLQKADAQGELASAVQEMASLQSSASTLGKLGMTRVAASLKSGDAVSIFSAVSDFIDCRAAPAMSEANIRRVMGLLIAQEARRIVLERETHP